MTMLADVRKDLHLVGPVRALSIALTHSPSMFCSLTALLAWHQEFCGAEPRSDVHRTRLRADDPGA